MRLNIFDNGLIAVRPMSKKEYEKHNKEAEKEYARLEMLFIREVLFEKYSESELYRRLRKIKPPKFDLKFFWEKNFVGQIWIGC
jgi:hypothetical protein